MRDSFSLEVSEVEFLRVELVALLDDLLDEGGLVDDLDLEALALLLARREYEYGIALLPLLGPAGLLAGCRALLLELGDARVLVPGLLLPEVGHPAELGPEGVHQRVGAEALAAVVLVVGPEHHRLAVGDQLQRGDVAREGLLAALQLHQDAQQLQLLVDQPLVLRLLQLLLQLQDLQDQLQAPLLRRGRRRASDHRR